VGTIRRLPQELADQIAAGEVVERPASIVKELIENAVDAGARRVSIETELGGKKRIRVDDDGEGMGPEDARLALERHATSKISRADDLAAIRTLGFRGEALPSIASVSRFVLRTRARGRQSGTEIRVSGGVVQSLRDAGIPEGTAVEVEDLFFNLPARRKFLKSDSAESAQVSRVVGRLALANPEIGFTLTSGGRPVMQCPPAGSLRDRFFQLHGERPDLVEVHREASGLRIFGYIAALAGSPSQGPTRGPQNLFVNRRIVGDRTIAHAIIDAYSVASIKERSPEVHLFIEMAPDGVDVNVHPAKAEVRFRDQSLVHEAVRRTLMDALGQGGALQVQLRADEGVHHVAPAALPGIVAGAAYPSRWAASAGVPAAATASEPDGARAASPPDIRPMIPLGQFRDTFIIAIDDDGVVIVDQHVAHERVLYERVMEKLSSGRLESQRLLVPMILELSPSAHQAIVSRAAELERLGFELESFGGASLKVGAVPALLNSEDSAKALTALGEDLEGLDRGAHVQDALQRIAATTACHAAVKANDPLTHEKMAHILEELRATAYSTVCPHGRPVMLRLTRREIEKNFDRI
jgi:DNA mismatch repair protein MutL